MDISTALMNNLKQQNPLAAQGVNQTLNLANYMQNQPQQSGLNSYLGNIGASIAGAPSNISTMQAIGQGLPGALQAMQKTSDDYINRQKEAIGLRMTAANTLDAVKKYEDERALRERKFGLEERKMAHMENASEEARRHHGALENFNLLKLAHAEGAKQFSDDKKRYEELLKKSDKSRQYLKDMESEDYKKIVKEGTSALRSFLPNLLRPGTDPNVVSMKLRDKGNQIPLTYDKTENALNYNQKRNALRTDLYEGAVAEKLIQYRIPSSQGFELIENMRPKIKEMESKGVPHKEIMRKVNDFTDYYLRKNGYVND